MRLISTLTTTSYSVWPSGPVVPPAPIADFVLDGTNMNTHETPTQNIAAGAASCTIAVLTNGARNVKLQLDLLDNDISGEISIETQDGSIKVPILPVSNNSWKTSSVTLPASMFNNGWTVLYVRNRLTVAAISAVRNVQEVPLTVADRPWTGMGTPSDTHNAPVGNTFLGPTSVRTYSSVWTLGFTGLQATPQTYLFEQGGSGIGVWAGFTDTGDFLIACGNMSAGGVKTDRNTRTRLIISGADRPTGDGTLTIQFASFTGHNTIVAYWNDTRLGIAKSTATSNLIGTDQGDLLTSPPTSASNMDAWYGQAQYTTFTGLNVYANAQIVHTGSDITSLR